MDKFTKLRKVGFPMACFSVDFYNLLLQLSKFAVWVVGWVLSINSKRFIDFIKPTQFFKILSVMLSGKTRGNLYIHFLVIII